MAARKRERAGSFERRPGGDFGGRNDQRNTAWHADGASSENGADYTPELVARVGDLVMDERLLFNSGRRFNFWDDYRELGQSDRECEAMFDIIDGDEDSGR